MELGSRTIPYGKKMEEIIISRATDRFCIGL